MTAQPIAMSMAASGLSTQALDSARTSLHRELTTQLLQAAECRATANELTGQSDVDSVLEREIAEASSLSAECTAADVRSALDRLNAGTYGACEQCNDPIPIERLEAIPHARLCVTCSERAIGLLG